MGCTLDAGPVMPALAKRAAAAPGPPRDGWKAQRKAGETGETGRAFWPALPRPAPDLDVRRQLHRLGPGPRRRPGHRGPL